MTDVAHKHYLEISARIVALEYLVKQLLWMEAEHHVEKHGGGVAEPIGALRQDAASSLQHATFPSLQPASLMAQELHDALDAQLAQTIARARASQ